jgi:hypothetical protein
MAAATFCSIDDIKIREPDIMKLAPDSGHFNEQLGAARQEIEDRLITSAVITDLDKLGPDIQPRQLRLPAIYKTLEIIFEFNAKDEESPYRKKADDYRDRFDQAYAQIKFLDLDSDEDGTLEDGEKDAIRMNSRTMRRV